MHHLKSMGVIDWNDDTYNGKALKLSAGVQGFEVLDFASRYGLTAVVGHCPSVGVVGGYIQGGGHSSLSSKYGLAADQTLEFEVVAASGEYRKVSRDHDPDLFWALSGGGPGTFAVVLSVVVRAYADVPTTTADLTFTASNLSQETFLNGVRSVMAHIPALHDAGCASWDYFDKRVFTMDLLICPGLSQNEVEAVMGPMKATLFSLGIRFQSSMLSLARYSDGSRTDWGGKWQDVVGTYQAATWLIPRSHVLDPQKNAELVSAIMDIKDHGGVPGLQTFSPTKNVAPRTDNAVFPSWRETALLVWVML